MTFKRYGYLLIALYTVSPLLPTALLLLASGLGCSIHCMGSTPDCPVGGEAVEEFIGVFLCGGVMVLPLIVITAATGIPAFFAFHFWLRGVRRQLPEDPPPGSLGHL